MSASSHFKQASESMSFPKVDCPPITPTEHGFPITVALNHDDESQRQALCQLAAKILEEPMLQIMLSERVYEMMQEDLTYDQKRNRGYGGGM